jgi:smad nuclear-interacting protein 1
MSSYYGPSSSRDSHQQSRKRSRWGDDSEQRQEQQRQQSERPKDRSNKPPPTTDEDAVNALLSSAQERQEASIRHDDKKHKQQQQETEILPPDEIKHANFGLSGALAKDEHAGNTYKGVVLKFSEPPEARAPNTQWRLYVFKGEEQLEILHISKQSAYLFGRHAEIADVPITHPSLSLQHAVLQYRALPQKETGKVACQPYLMDLESTNGTFLNGVQIDAARYYQLKKGDVIKFGASTREYVLLTANTTSLT